MIRLKKSATVSAKMCKCEKSINEVLNEVNEMK